jgi:hypothetical protein
MKKKKKNPLKIQKQNGTLKPVQTASVKAPMVTKLTSM